MKNPLLLWAAFLSILIAGTPAKSESVKSVYDGDTLTLTTGEKVRLACIDTPEMRNTAKKKADKPAAIAARDHLIKLIDGGEIVVDRIQTDLYGRTVARLYKPDGTELSLEMYKSGYAKLFTGYTKPCPWAQ